MKISIDKNLFLDFINLKNSVFYPLSEFCNKKQCIDILDKYEISKDNFFPIPILFGISKETFERLKKNRKSYADIYYINKKVCKIQIKSFFFLNKKKYGKKIFNSSSLKHPGYKYFSQFYKFVDFKILNFNNNITKNLNFHKPENIKKKLKKYKKIAGFHTRNIPHRGHEWIHDYALKKCDGLLIQPLIGQFKVGEFTEKEIIKCYKKYLKLKKNKKIFLSFFNNYPRYAGPREALLHALVRRNYGCTHFLVGRDHAGYQNFYQLYESQKIAKKKESKLGIKIITFKEPLLCKRCLKIANKRCSKVKKCNFSKISGTYIRNLIKSRKKISDIFLRSEIGDKLNVNSIINN